MNKKSLAYLLVAVSVIFSIACNKQQASGNSGSVQNVTVKSLKEKLDKNPGLFVLDVRTPSEYKEYGHIKGAKLLPISQLTQRMAELTDMKNNEIYVICASGQRSLAASRYLRKQGFGKVYNVLGGMYKWKGSSFAVEYGGK